MPEQSQTAPMSLLESLERCPPFAVYYASHLLIGKRLTVVELANRAGLSHRTFTRVARAISWEGIKVGVADGFSRGCGADLLSLDVVLEKLTAEASEPEPFKALDGPRRTRMLKCLNLLGAKAALLRKQRDATASA